MPLETIRDKPETLVDAEQLAAMLGEMKESEKQKVLGVIVGIALAREVQPEPTLAS